MSMNDASGQLADQGVDIDRGNDDIASSKSKERNSFAPPEFYLLFVSYFLSIIE